MGSALDRLIRNQYQAHSRALTIGLLAITYAASGWLGLQLAVPPGYATLIWPASGIAMGALLHYGYRLFPGIFIGAFFVNILRAVASSADGIGADGIMIAYLIAVGSTFQAIVGAGLAARLFGRPLQFRRPSHLIPFLIITAPLSQGSRVWDLT